MRIIKTNPNKDKDNKSVIDFHKNLLQEWYMTWNNDNQNFFRNDVRYKTKQITLYFFVANIICGFY